MRSILVTPAPYQLLGIMFSFHSSVLDIKSNNGTAETQMTELRQMAKGWLVGPFIDSGDNTFRD